MSQHVVVVILIMEVIDCISFALAERAKKRQASADFDFKPAGFNTHYVLQ